MMLSGVCFDDVLLVPRRSDVTSRKDINLSNYLQEGEEVLMHFRLPIISSPMDTVTESEMLVAMSQAGGLGIVHRYNSIEAQVALIKIANAEQPHHAGAAVGVTGDYLDRARAVVDAGANVICIDVAHGHHVLMEQALKSLRDALGDSIHLMAGNVATLQGFNDLADWGADSVRVGVGGGSICSTRVQTGHGVPTLQSVLDCAQSDRDVALIADGGIRTSGDIVKALAAGADFVMLGSLLAGTQESPGEIISPSDSIMVVENAEEGYAYADSPGLLKKYRGMASVEAQIDWRGHASSVEGVSTTIPYKGPVENILKALERGIRSGLSYSGATSISKLHARAKFMKQSYSGAVESSTHILDK
jgi:IMP dehydrogenase